MPLLVSRTRFEHAEQRSFPEDRATVSAAIDDLAGDFTIKASGDGTWVLGARKPDVEGTLELGTDGEHTTLVLRVAPNFRYCKLPQLVTAYHVAFASLWLGLGLFLWLVVHADFFTSFILPALFGAMADDTIRRRLVHRYGPDYYALPASALIERVALWSSRRGRRWIARWHARFWPALTARLAQARPNR